LRGIRAAHSGRRSARQTRFRLLPHPTSTGLQTRICR